MITEAEIHEKVAAGEMTYREGMIQISSEALEVDGITGALKDAILGILTRVWDDEERILFGDPDAPLPRGIINYGE